jgi:hypothetical protein
MKPPVQLIKVCLHCRRLIHKGKESVQKKQQFKNCCNRLNMKTRGQNLDSNKKEEWKIDCERITA